MPETSGTSRITPLREIDVERAPQPPHNIEQEQALLGAILHNNVAYHRVANFLKGEHFSNPANGRIFEAIAVLIATGKPANKDTLKNLFNQDGALKEIGGAKYLADLEAFAVTIINAEFYGRDIYDQHLRRELITIGQDVVTEAYREDLDPNRNAASIAREYADRLDRVHQARSSALGAGLGEWDAGDDDQPIPPRGFLLGNVFCRRFVSSLIAGGGVGKTAVRIAQALSLATGRPLTGEHVFQRCRVLLISLEDDRDELRRRVEAATRRYEVSKADVKGWLFLAASGDCKLASTENGEHQHAALEAELRATIKLRAIDIVILDPFVKSHGVEENANNAIDFVAGILSKIAIDYDCAIDAPHHVSKGAPEAGNADRGRGASAFKDSARLVYTLTPMTPEEATQFGLSDEERRSLIRMDSAKVNITPPARSSKWFKLIGVCLDNGSELYPTGDEVQVIEPWNPPDLWDGISEELARLITAEIDAGLPGGRFYTNAPNAKDRAAAAVVQKHLPDRTDVQAREIVKRWLENDVLRYEEYPDPTDRKPRKGLKMNHANQPGVHAWSAA